MSAEVFIPLTRGKVAVIDFPDFEKVRDLNWQALRGSKTWYAVTTVERRQIYMHREDEEDAARAYDSAARRHYGEFARPNFP